MNSPISPDKLRAGLLAVFGSISAVISPAQTALANESSSPAKKAEEVVVLSPFAVTANSDVGYRATTSLAGSRLNAPLRDLGAPVQVLTSELFKDVGATDASTILQFATNMEVAGSQGNFAGGRYGDGIGYGVASQRVKPQSEGQRVRGLAAASLTRNYFLTSIPFDQYNTERVTISRGPNSLLFGIGSVAGIIDSTTKDALPYKNSGEITVRAGEHGSNRETLDFNLALIRNRLALRIDAMRQDTQYDQRPAFQKDKRLSGALTAVLFKNQGSRILGPTTLKANAEVGRMDGLPPLVIPPIDGLAPWFALPKYSAAEIAAYMGGPIPANLAWLSNGSFVPKLVIDNRSAGLNETNITNTGKGPFFVQLPVIYNDMTSKTATIGLADASIQGTLGRLQWQLLNPLVPGKTKSQDFLSLFPIETNYLPSFKPPVIQNRGTFDNQEILLAGENGYVAQKFAVQNVSLEQTLFGGRGGILAAFSREKHTVDSQLFFDSGESNLLWIDINQYLANGEANPNVGRAFIMSGLNPGGGPDATKGYEENKRAARQVTVFYKWDLSERAGWVGWLGKHTFTGFLGHQTFENTTLRRVPVWNDIPGSNTNITLIQGGGMTNARRVVFMVSYVTPSLLGGAYSRPADVAINQSIATPFPQEGERYKLITSHNFGAPVLNPANGTPTYVDEFQVYDALWGGTHSLQTIDSGVASWQVQLLKDQVIGLVGFRRDKSVTLGTSANNSLPTGEWDIANNALDSNTRALDTGDTVSKSLVVHIPESWTKALPFNVSLNYSASDNFSAVPSRNDIQRQAIASPKGATEDYGLTFESKNGRLSLRLNHFETSSQLSTADLGSATNLMAGGQVSNMLKLVFQNQSDSLSIQQFLSAPGQPADAITRFSSYQGIYDAILNLSLADGNQYQTNTNSNTPVFGTWLNPIDRVAATTDFVAKGYEVDLAGAITKNWNVFLNVAQQETVQTNTGELVREAAVKVQDEINGSKLKGILVSPSRGAPNTFDSDLQQGVLNGLFATLAKDGTVSAEQRKWRVNVATVYNFSGGRLKGFRVGAAARWQSKIAIGYPNLQVVSGAVTPDLAHPYFGKPLLDGDVWLGYSRRLRTKNQWSVQLNVRNLIGSEAYIPVFANPDGSVAIVRNPAPMDISLTTSLTF